MRTGAVEQQQTPAGLAGSGVQGHPRRGQGGVAAQGGLHPETVFMVSGQQRHGGQSHGQGHPQPARIGVAHQQLPQPCVTTPALVLAEIATQEKPVGRGAAQRQLLEGAGQTVAQQGQRGPAAAESAGIGQQVGITELKDAHRCRDGLRCGHPRGNRPKFAVRAAPAMPAIPPGTRRRCTLCQVEIQGMAGGNDLVHFSMGAPGSRAKLWARVCQYLRSPEQCGQCLNQDPQLRGTVTASDYYAEAPVLDLSGMGPAGAGGAGAPGGDPLG